MRITHDRTLHATAGYYNPTKAAHDEYLTCYHYDRTRISRAEAYRTTIDAVFQPYAFPGGYPVIATLEDGSVLCPSCARSVFLHERLDVNVDLYFEGPTYHCESCGEELPSAYGDPTAEEEHA